MTEGIQIKPQAFKICCVYFSQISMFIEITANGKSNMLYMFHFLYNCTSLFYILYSVMFDPPFDNKF
jgi:hypothetical protein